MSERRTAEIKFRCTPTFKASLAAAADATDRSLTEFIESAVESTLRSKQNQALDSALLASSAVYGPRSEKADCCVGHPVNADAPCDDCPLVGKAQSEYGGPDAPALSVASGFQNRTDGGTEMECGPEAPPQTKCAGNCRPWEFCHCKAEA